MENVVYIKQNRCWTNSKVLADKFGKKHQSVLRVVRQRMDEMPNDFQAGHFAHVEILEKNAIGGTVNRSYYEMTYDGFLFVALAFTGKKAAQFRWEVIQEFNRRGAELEKRGLPTLSIEDLLRLTSEALKNEVEAHAETKRTSLAGTADLTALNDAIKRKASEFGYLGGAAFGLIYKCLKARFAGARAVGTFKEISKGDLPEALSWTEGLGASQLLAAKGVKNTDAGLVRLRDTLRALDGVGK